MPFSPRRIIGGPPGYVNGSFSSAEQEHPTAPNQNQQLRSNTPHIASRGPRKQSKFFAKRGGAVMISRPPSGYASSSGKSTPDFVNGGPVRRFTQTPGPGNNGPFKAPPQPPFPQTQQFFGPGNNGHAHKRAASSFSSAENGTCPPNKSEPAVSSGPPLFLTKNGRSSAPRATMANSTRGQTPAPLSKELAIVRNDQERNGKFAAGVVHPSGGLDAVRVYDMFHFYNSIKDWVDKYCSAVNESAMHNMSRQHPRLWDYACTVTYPNNRHNASSHALYMLLNKPYRSFFISRLVIQFFVQQMWNSQAWEGMDEQLTDLLISVKHRLDFKYGYDAALQPHERHALVDKRSRAISDFINRPSWSKFQAQKVTYAMSRAKDILGPMLDLEKVDRDSADHELHIICEEGVELSTKLFTSPLSFQFIFNECGIKFSDQSHRPLNSSIPSRELQAHHWRVMCVVTPGITYRNDAGVSVDPRFLAKANVLLMQ
ncbi:hypothetical protein SPBR_01643 [Sporothrix brasiliensis 5110]|uniref:Uncharacterized protein n=1 Tax=Sporothrix brasiliensis 5110 TaxID=1398154 RepID=A0A0C2IQH6_9PEZI|nr:uncharacterized protein SPBR_01643 [Sporothrix brasiliensis 5110]KIH91296.1 hypothetical protein SPBR_01643 [Sporothrix brasiliensis 5110]